MTEKFQRREKINVKKAKHMPSRREVKRVLKVGPAKKLKKQILKLKSVKKLKFTLPPKEQATTVVKLAKELKRRVAKQVRGKLRGDLKKSSLLNMKFRLKNPSFIPKQKGRLIFKLKGLGAGLKYRKKGSTFEVAVKKGPDKRTPVDASVRGALRVPGQESTTLQIAYNHANRKFSVGGIFKLKQAGTLLGRTAQLDLRAGTSISPTGADYNVTGSYGHKRLQFQVRTDVNYQGGRVNYQVVGGLSARF